MRQSLILAIDQGTTASRAVVVDARGTIVADSKCEFPQYYPRPGWVEHDLEQIWRSVLCAVNGAMARVEDGWRRVAAIGVTNQRETIGVWERRSGRPVAPAIVWQCRRTAQVCDHLRQTWAATIQRATGLTVDPYFLLGLQAGVAAGSRTRAAPAQRAVGGRDR